MLVRLNRVNDRVHLRACNDRGNRVDIDGSRSIGGEDAGFRPMELLLTALASCSTMDLVPILEKQRQRLDDIEIEVEGTRRDATPSPFSRIHLRFLLTGEIDEVRAGKAISLSVEKYCSVAETLSPEVEITHSFKIIRPSDPETIL